MTDYTSLNSTERMEFIRRSLNRRHASEKRLRFYGVAAICFALGFLVVLLTTARWVDAQDARRREDDDGLYDRA